MLITSVTTESSRDSDDNVVIKISHGIIVVKMTTKIFTVYSGSAAWGLSDESAGSIRMPALSSARRAATGLACSDSQS